MEGSQTSEEAGDEEVERSNVKRIRDSVYFRCPAIDSLLFELFERVHWNLSRFELLALKEEPDTKAHSSVYLSVIQTILIGIIE